MRGRGEKRTVLRKHFQLCRLGGRAFISPRSRAYAQRNADYARLSLYARRSGM
ncbi:hypothetical protein PUN28_008972 [Cardiocondyla obscurior]|uniref:Uncharacterized protein n=1 Tax=Cardiocondyla obscurior TaxID=286306 RepID=A0AAW2FVL0_9HYME